ncbi:TPA: 4Fe-4S dicluster domain-containing protein [Candidatus Micrarchaeota archaeon]|nr:4Fe-4S dicluster domain-containing protein [Candidatus Micrarchaeota archaeon]
MRPAPHLYLFPLPLSMAGGSVPLWRPSNCIRCGLCVGVCPTGAVRLTEGGVVIDPELCAGCGLCVKGCPVAALYFEETSSGGGAREE